MEKVKLNTEERSIMSNMQTEIQASEMKQTDVKAEEESDPPVSACHVNRRLIPVKINCFSQFFGK